MKPRARRRPDWSTLPPPHADLRCTVIMPVRNEARRLPGALRALSRQCGRDGRPLDGSSFEVIVLANNCSDASAEVVRAFAARHPRMALHVVEVRFPDDVAHVGHARVCLMDEACRRLEQTAGGTGVIASTDGDTCVAPDWLAQTAAEIARGAHAVGGRIVNGADVALPPGLLALARRDAHYQRLRVHLEHLIDPDDADPWPRHHQHFGASLAVTVAAYRQVGGIPPEPFLEDEAFYRQLRRHDLPVRHSHRVCVVTSSRRQGRVAVGLSWQLRVWHADQRAGHDPHVADPALWAREVVLRRRLRMLWRLREARLARGETQPGAREVGGLKALAGQTTFGVRRLEQEWRRAASFGALWALLESRLLLRRRDPAPAVPMQQAIGSLRALISQRRARLLARRDRGDTSAAGTR